MSVETVDKVRKVRRLDSAGKPMRRLVLVLTQSDYAVVSTALTTRISPLFSRAFSGEAVNTDLPEDESRGVALARICCDWQESLESNAESKASA